MGELPSERGTKIYKIRVFSAWVNILRSIGPIYFNYSKYVYLKTDHYFI